MVEAFVIPTGSMAPTLLGAHLRVSCEQCGHEYSTDVPHTDAASDNGDYYVPAQLTTATTVICPMCRNPNRLPAGTRTSSGDRILVQKYVYSIRGPRRWDVAVFRNPQKPEQNYIKRLVGLPSEALLLFDGNIHVTPLDGDRTPVHGQWRIARKGSRPDVQRELWQPMYHSQYIPLDGGRPGVRARGGEHKWQVPWEAQGPTRMDWQIENRRSYRYENHRPGEIAFDFRHSGDHRVAGLYPYNQHRAGWLVEEPVEDVRLAASFEPDQAGLRVTMTTTARLHDEQHRDVTVGAERLIATLDEDGQLVLTAADLDTGEPRAELARVQVAPLAAGQTTRVELWFVDQEAIVWIDGRDVLRRRFDPDMAVLRERPAPLPRPTVLGIEVAGTPVTLHQVELDRDLYYSDRQNGVQARGSLMRSGDELEGEPLVLREDEFFPVGDNGPHSADGRYWRQVNHWIEERFFLGRLAEGEDPAGLVPRELLMGRAFFVYFPAPYPWQAGGRQVIPNFGDMRFIR